MNDQESNKAKANLFQVLKDMFRDEYKRDLTPAEEVKLRIIFNAQVMAMQPQKSRKVSASDLAEVELSFQRSYSERSGSHLSPSEVMMPTRESVDLYYQKYGTKDDPYPKFVCKPIELEINAAQDGFERNCEEQVKRIVGMLEGRNEEEPK
jgi:hypothetical protein